MTELMITECPGCHARFRVTEGQLKLAAGKVRCGACLLVFDADIEAQHLAQHLQQRFEATQQRPRPKAGPAAPARQGQAPTAEQSSIATPAATPDQPPSPEAQHGFERTPSAPDEERSERLAPVAEADNVSETVVPAPSTAPHESGRLPPPPILELHAEPLILEVSEEQDTAYATAGWLLAILLAVAVLALQFLWFERASLARDPGLHPFYALLCDSVNCDLSHNAVGEIVNQQLVIRPHPKYGDALSVSLRLLNRAPFAQPFPDLLLSFRDLKGHPVAERRFHPGDYLDTDHFDVHQMPPDTPIELRLDILDPGSQAVSYDLKIEPAG